MLDIPAHLPVPTNEPILGYLPGSKERTELKARLIAMRNECPDVPHLIGKDEVRDGEAFGVQEPHLHARKAATCHQNSPALTERAIKAALDAQHDWASMPFDSRARIFMKAADLLAGPWRATINAATMLGQSKTAYQAEIDAACELADFLRFNVHFASRLAEQPISGPGIYNALELRPLEGFVLAITPFNFTAIGANLVAAPTLMGNVVLWKPAENQGLSAYYTMRLFQEAGMPPGVMNVLWGDGKRVSDVCLANKHLAGIHFTGSTFVFQDLMKNVGARVAEYATYPRLVGETGGKDFVFAHPSAHIEALATGLVRGAFEYQGQKCSAASRAYIPKSLWPKVKSAMVDMIKAIKIGDPTDFRNFMGAVINERAHTRLSGWLERMKKDSAAEVITSDGWSKDVGYFAGPTLVRVDDPRHEIMSTELFGPMLSVYVYDDAKLDETLELVDTTSPYALTGAIFSQDRAAVVSMSKRLRNAAGNFYVNDKPTGAVVGQQPFGGARASGTNDKAGSAYNLLRWASPRTVKETFAPPTDPFYGMMSAE